VRPDFALTEGNAAAVAEICRRLEGLPLAIELAAARTRLLDPAALLRRLTASFDALGTGAVDLPERQRTLRATVEWSVGLLEDAERSLLETMAVFVDGWTLEAAAEVAGLSEDRALELTEALARHSLIYLDGSADGARPRMPETIRAFVAERLAARPDVAEIQRRHAAYYRALAERADRPLRGAGHLAWLERLEAEAGNLAAGVRWYLAHDRAPLPHLFRVQWLFWELRDQLGEADAWIEQLLPTADSLEPQARAELLWAAAATANSIQDDPAALAASQRLAPLLDRIEDPFLHALCLLVMAWGSPITGDFDAAIRQALASLEELHGQDEPYWTAVAAVSAGYLELDVGHDDDALRHTQEVRDLAERFGYSWLAAWSRVQLGRLDIVRGWLDEARELLDEALGLSLAVYVTRNVTLCLVAYAQLAMAEGEPERAALLAGAIEGLRRRAGLGAWPMLRRNEAALMDQIRQALGTDRLEQAYESGAQLSQREAVAEVRGRRGASAQQP
jgi:tetratricopeptide (TPR) repeat protein